MKGESIMRLYVVDKKTGEKEYINTSLNSKKEFESKFGSQFKLKGKIYKTSDIQETDLKVKSTENAIVGGVMGALVGGLVGALVIGGLGLLFGGTNNEECSIKKEGEDNGI